MASSSSGVGREDSRMRTSSQAAICTSRVSGMSPMPGSPSQSYSRYFAGAKASREFGLRIRAAKYSSQAGGAQGPRPENYGGTAAPAEGTPE